VLRDVAEAADWPAAHAWVPGAQPNTWVSSGLWFPDDAIGLGALRRACLDAEAGPARGNLALALHLEATQWVSDLGGLRGTGRYDAAVAAGLRSAVACPVYARGRAVAILEWYLTSPERPGPDIAHALAHLSAVLSEVAERPVPMPVPAQRSALAEVVRWVTEEGVTARLLAV
jgi:hypothetical protein